MAYEDQGALQQAAPTNDANGQIQKMFQMIANKRMAEMEAQQGRPDPRQAALQQYQSALRANPAGTFTPTDQSLNTTIAGFGRMSPLAAAAGGIAAGGDMVRNLASAKYRGEVGATKAGYDDVIGQDKNDINELGQLAKEMRAAKLNDPKMAATEKLNDIYGRALSQARMEYGSKNPNMSSEEVMAKSREYANSIVEEYAQRFGIGRSDIPRSLGQPSAPSVGGGQAEPMPTQVTLPKVVETPSTDPMKVSPSTQYARDMDRLAILEQEAKDPANKSDVASYAALLKEIEFTKASLAKGAGQSAAQPAPRSQAAAGGAKTPEQTLTNISVESPYGPALNLAPMEGVGTTKRDTQKLDASRKAFLDSDDYKTLGAQAAGAKLMKDIIQPVLDSTAKTDAFTTATQLVNNMGRALGIELDKETVKNMAEIAKVDQAKFATALQGQLQQKGVQTDKDFVRILQAAFDTNMTPDIRKAVATNYMDNLNRSISRQRYMDQYLQHPNSHGQERNWESKYIDYKNSGMPESVLMPNKKLLPFDEAAKSFWSSDVGKAYKPSAKDSPEDVDRKQKYTLRALNQYNARMRKQFEDGVGK